MESLKDFAQFTLNLSALVDTQVEFDKRFPTQMSPTDIASWLIQLWGNGALFFADFFDNGEVKFFSVIEIADEEAQWHVLFSHPRYKYKTKQCVNDIKDELRARGVKTIYSKTRRVTPSYKRWMASLESYPIEIVYKCKL